MELRQLGQGGNKVINKYDDYGFYISNKRIDGVVIIFYDYIDILGTDIDHKLNKNDLEPLILAEPSIDLLIIGHEKGLQFFVPEDLSLHLKNNNIKIEKMITSSACRTYNLLVGENRKVACILFPSKKQ